MNKQKIKKLLDIVFYSLLGVGSCIHFILFCIEFTKEPEPLGRFLSVVYRGASCVFTIVLALIFWHILNYFIFAHKKKVFRIIYYTVFLMINLAIICFLVLPNDVKQVLQSIGISLGNFILLVFFADFIVFPLVYCVFWIRDNPVEELR